MAAGAFFESKGVFPVMTCAAGPAFFHLCHGNVLLFFQIKDGIVTGPAIIVQPFPAYMFGMAEYHFACVFSKIDCISHRNRRHGTLN
jgi:hypothetical protein